MKDFSSNDALTRKNIGPIVIVSQLLQLMTDMQHSDELFAWLASTVVEQFGVVSAQTWAIQAYSDRGSRTKLRASASRHPSQASRVQESAEVKVFIERMFLEQRSILSIPVNNMFSQYQATIFAQQDCLYWTTCFLSNDELLPPPQNNSVREEVATPLQMIFSFFTKDPLQPSDVRAIRFLLDQALRLATSKGLLVHKV
jgi:hypothetical protein